MELYITAVPLWVNLTFLLSFPIGIILIGQAVQKAYLNANQSSDTAKKKQRNTLLFYGFYLAAVAVTSATGLFSGNSLPPRILIFTTLPLLAFYLFYVMRSDWYHFIIKNVTLQTLIFIHAFRFIGIFFFITYSYGALPWNFALAGGAGDIIAALLGFCAIYAINHRKSYAIRLTYIWNIVGLLDIINVIITAIIVTKISIANNEVGVAEFATFPFSWIPAFAPATIIFLHIGVFQKLKMMKKH
jgi:hypothetical protein